MKLSTKSRYACRLMINLAKHFELGPLQLKEISKEEGISEKYLGQIVISLKNAGLIKSIRGAKGGYLLAEDPEFITLSKIVSVMEGGLEIVDCLDVEKTCSRETVCLTKEVWENVSRAIKLSLDQYNLKDLADKIKTNEIIYFI